MLKPIYSIFFAEHELGQQLKHLSELLDEYPQTLAWVAQDFDKTIVASTGACQKDYEKTPHSVVADGCYASQENVRRARELGAKRTVFSKPAGLGLHAMGVKKKTFKALRDFRAGVEGNISELKRAFGLSKATWKGHCGFMAYVWSSVLSYNLIRRVRFSLG